MMEMDLETAFGCVLVALHSVGDPGRGSLVCKGRGLAGQPEGSLRAVGEVVIVPAMESHQLCCYVVGGGVWRRAVV